jgi:iron complex transport system permease protein
VTWRTTLLGLLCLALGALAGLCCGPDGFGLSGLAEPSIVALRGTRVALGAIVGAGLSVVGAALQAALRNPLADPFVLGVSGGAAMGAALVLVGVGAALIVPGAVVGAIAACALLLGFVRVRGASGEGAVLVGVVVNAFSWAVVAVVRVTVPAAEAASLSVWLIGALDYPSSSTLLLALLTTGAGAAVLVHHAGALAIVRGGDDDAARLGIDVPAVRLQVFCAASLLVGVAVASTGVIGFVGLLVPHAVRRLGSSDDRVVIPLSALVGAGTLAALDGVSRAAFVVVGSELPVGAVCALLGAPLLALLLVRDAQRSATW